MMKILVVEDDDRRISWFKQQAIGLHLDVATTVEEAKAFLEKNNYDKIFLDHDLTDEHYKAYDGVTCDGRFDHETGFAIASWLGVHRDNSKDAEIVVHTLNDPAAKRMVRELHLGRRNYRRTRFSQLTQERGAGFRLNRKERSIW